MMSFYMIGFVAAIFVALLLKYIIKSKEHSYYIMEMPSYKIPVWIKPIKIPFARFYKMKNYHIADYNLFWLNIRNNLRFRLEENGYN